jgi:hypothetical protein
VIIELKTRYDLVLDEAIRIPLFEKLYFFTDAIRNRKREQMNEREKINARQIVLIFVDKQSMTVQ